MAHPLARIVEQLKREPSRTGSIVITVFGDAIVPRGGSVWLGTLLEFFGTIDIDSGVVRTAMSRLPPRRLLQRSQGGPNTFLPVGEKKGGNTFGRRLRGVWVAPSGVPVPEEAARAIRLEVSAEDDSGRRLLSESWPLDRTADAYLKFMKTFEPLRGWIGRRERLTDVDAFTARILLIHYYRPACRAG